MKEEIEKEEATAELLGQYEPEATGTINLKNARAYAEKYYKNYNKGYPEFGNDCTNFVSQILAEGGRREVYPMHLPSYTTDSKYWYMKKRPDNSWGWSKSWTVVSDLYAHLVRTQKGYSSTSKSSIISNAKSGDVIQFKKPGADRYSHTMWIYEKQSSNLLLSGHDNDYLKRSFNAITGYAKYRIIKM
ncbi:hypothetical protein B5V89_05965 [Heyndrickxia sporothermodurans]|uniref:amidase domain-containing protein n=1 Tax=Heyndrickxia TaxID=2837504 RepID=UPI000D3880D7|nr:amidase domain-containing protein [Heyndrickxia sporothermodurans]MED3653136.1 amidase domain-containing protein [Heyndrickxia sporothermodurans]MED3780006.1 amidase domain-containing protein [Heyndrickxia sporothermodurans]PTY79499.1 hypothetical protein B5V89_05965 [Heyndrickxia sporothermodurans]